MPRTSDKFWHLEKWWNFSDDGHESYRGKNTIKSSSCVEFRYVSSDHVVQQHLNHPINMLSNHFIGCGALQMLQS